MDTLQLIKNQLLELIQGIESHSTNQTEIIVLTYHTEKSFELLAWLKAQQSYPQFYLNFRDKMQKIVALGKVRTFSSLTAAQNFLQHSNVPLLGGLTFYSQAEFFLPRILLTEQANKLTIQLFVDQANSLSEEICQLLNILNTFTKTTALEPINQSIRLLGKKADQQQWCDWVESALVAIRQGILSKVVLANETLFEAEKNLNAVDFLAESEHANFGCYHFLFAEDQQKIFVGSTPERLYHRQGQQLHTEALAGTALRSEDEHFNRSQSDWLLHDEKNTYENQLVAEGLKQSLAPYATSIRLSEPELKPLRLVQHLKRNIFVQLVPDCRDDLCLQTIHPTAAVAGLPKQSAVEFLQKTENFDRCHYAGTLGIMEKSQAEFCVTIRCAFIENNKIRVFAGAGIVEGSIPC